MQYSPLYVDRMGRAHTYVCTYAVECIMHQTLPNRNVYSIYQTDRDDRSTLCRGHFCHSFGHKVHAFAHADITPSGAFLPGLSVSCDGLLPNREPLAYRGMHTAGEVMLVDDSSQADTAPISA